MARPQCVNFVYLGEPIQDTIQEINISFISYFLKQFSMFWVKHSSKQCTYVFTEYTHITLCYIGTLKHLPEGMFVKSKTTEYLNGAISFF